MKYYVNKNAQSTGEHEIHKETCLYLPSSYHLQYLGNYNDDNSALREARRYYSNVDGCIYCCPIIHKK